MAPEPALPNVAPPRVSRAAVGTWTSLALGLLLLLLGGLLAGPPASAATHSPSGLKAIGRSRSAIAVTWSAVAGAPKYRIQISRSSSMSNATYHRYTGTRAELTGLKSSTTYYLKVRVISTGGKNLSSYSKAIKVTTRSSGSYRYLSPAGLRSIGSSPTSATLAWSVRASGVRYRVQYARSASMSGAAYVRTTPTMLSLEKMRAATTYWFKVRVIDASGKNLSEYSPAVKVTTRKLAASDQPLRIGSYNIKCANCFGGLANELPWTGRRTAVVAAIRAANLDVVGLQEAGQAWLRDANGKLVNTSQFEDLMARMGAPWRLTNTKRNNCVKDTTPTKCVWADKGASKGTKILYNSDKVEVLQSGSKMLAYDKAEVNERYVAWAVMRQRSTGAKFFFADAHLEPGPDTAGSHLFYDLRRRQANDLVATLKAKNSSKLPTILVGDFNSHKFTVPSNGPYDIVTKAGYDDPLGNIYESTTNTWGATVEQRYRTYLNSFNGFRRLAPAHPTWVNGTNIDYILTTGLRVSEFETVAKLDSAGNFVGVIPSDHNMIRATIYLS
jgi:endonuclease/exonuclease/phosphatase family metal-dependent hydrolase